MTTPTAWAHLPNARHIDAVLADVKARPGVWDATWRVVHRVLTISAINAMRAAQSSADRHGAFAEAQATIWAAAQGNPSPTALAALHALIAWDDSADLLDLSPDALRTLMDVATAPVCNQAALLLAWAIVRETT